jgi:diacylglycerol kinase
VKSFAFAFAGLDYLIRTQSNFWIHLTAALCVVLFSVLLGLDGAELAALALAIGLVLLAEAMNTALEAAVNLASPDIHPLAKAAKDVAAAGVLIAALTALAVGTALLLPRLLAIPR